MMKKLLPLLLLLLAPLAHAQPAVIKYTACGSAYPPSSCTIPSDTYVAGDQIVVQLQSENGTLGTVTFQDAEWTTNYTAEGTITNGNSVQYLFKFTVPSGYTGTLIITPTVSMDEGAAFAVYHVGPYSSPTIDTGAAVTNSGTGNAFSINVSAAHGNEFLLMSGQNTANACSSSTTGTWTNSNGGSTDSMSYYNIGASSGANNFACTLNVSGSWTAISLGIYDASGGSSCTHAGWTQAGTFAVPNASSTIVYRQDGNMGTVPCTGSGASNSYWQQSTGVFGVN